MEVRLADNVIAVGGATSGLGLAITERLIEEGAIVLGFARSRDKLKALATKHGDRFISHPADTQDNIAVRKLGEAMIDYKIAGCVFNTGGPPTGSVSELSMQDWDTAYASTLRWKIALTGHLLPMFRKRKSGKLLYLESVSIKQPIDNLVLSNTMRAAVAGFVKTLSREEGENGIRANILAPGYHATSRITAVLDKAAQLKDASRETVEKEFLAGVPTGKMGNPDDFAAMAAFLLSPLAEYITGQTISVDGGLVRHITG
ncbi:3-oxoacyl-[acyl-carrier protein] reductase [Neolewinella xylanilytica]|uniref:3-oxoacyl-[acyl-carrier protein] reductase n=1 Tax=Neolewinella xylanilytica TaxID=1514080 RepID=A0A2S6I022_9BACT|nr:SDR family oxidoreductase [Neolewinella xylanilytica]PPK84130.1 3-oxoacyl-[acyl-carrier protein] reductase [Neolewinella xylanilytica]